MLKKQNGNTLIGMPIITVVVFLLLMVIIITFVRLMEPLVIYEKMSSASLKYIFIMEEYGFLSNKEKTNLITELSEKGLNSSKLTVFGTDTLKDYGEPIWLKISYTHEIKMPDFVDSIIPDFHEKPININIEKKSFSKR
jgi:competence protein ComGC